LDINDSDIDREYSVSGYVGLLTHWRVLMVIMNRLENVDNEEVEYVSNYRGRREFFCGHS
jgi:hypothetical protein